MPLPPPKKRKHSELSVATARTRHLVPHQFRPGRSGNPEGFGGARREQYEEIARIAISGAPEELRNLQRMARESTDERVRVMASKTFLEFVPRSVLERIAEAEFAPSSQRSPAEIAELLAWANSPEVREWLARRLSSNGLAAPIDVNPGEPEDSFGCGS